MELKKYLEKAKRGRWAIGQFNFSTLEQLRGILAAAKKMKSPVIIGTSEGELNFLGLLETIALVEISRSKYGVKAFLNLDHGKNMDLIKKSIDYGYSAVHFDGSSVPFEKNVKYAKKIVGEAHKKGILAEGEIDDIQKKSLTDAGKAKEFVEKTKIDSLAVAIGSIHGFYKNIKLDFERLSEIKSNTDVFLVLHGGSGIPDGQIKKAIALGMNKINVNTELRMAWKEGISLAFKKGEIKPYNVLTIAQEAVQKKVEEKIKLFGSFNKI